jgi:hypothetical protein
MNKKTIPSKDEFLARHNLLVNYDYILKGMDHSVARGFSYYEATYHGDSAGIQGEAVRSRFSQGGYRTEVYHGTDVHGTHKKGVRTVTVKISWDN